MKEERLFFLRRMNAWPPPRRPPVRASRRGRARRRRPARPTAADAGGAGDAAALPAALHQAGPGRLPRPPGSGAPPAADLPARRPRAVLLERVPPQAGALLRAGAGARHPVAGRAAGRHAPRGRGARRAAARGWQRVTPRRASSSSARSASAKRTVPSAATWRRPTTWRACPKARTSTRRLARAGGTGAAVGRARRRTRGSAGRSTCGSAAVGRALRGRRDARRRLDWHGGRSGDRLPDRGEPGRQRPADRGRARRCSARRRGRTDLARLGLWAADGADPLRAGASPLHLELLPSAGAAAAVSPPS